MAEAGTVSDTTLIIIAFISAMPAILVALINRRAHKETRTQVEENTEKTTAILHQVQNDHKTNLREDLDKLKTDVEGTLEKIEAAQGYLGRTLGSVLHELKKTSRDQKAHDIASALVVNELKKRDDDLYAEMVKHHPDIANPGYRIEIRKDNDHGNDKDNV